VAMAMGRAGRKEAQQWEGEEGIALLHPSVTMCRGSGRPRRRPGV
jgi:hypothetical protein